MPHPISPTQAHLRLLSYALLIGTSFPIASFLGSSYSPLLTTLARFTLAALGFVLLMHYQSRLYWPRLEAILRYALISLPLTSFFLLMFISGETAPALAMGSLSTLVPLFSCGFGWLLWRLRPQPQRIIALLLGVFGALWVLTEGDFGRLGQGGWPIGNSWFVLACALMGLYPLVLRQLHRGEPMLVVTGWSLITGTGWLLLACILVQPGWQWPNLAQTSAILWLATATTMLTFFLFQSASLVVGGSSANAYSLLTPVVVIGINWGLDHPLPGLAVLPGIVLIGFSLLWLLRQDRRLG